MVMLVTIMMMMVVEGQYGGDDGDHDDYGDDDDDTTTTTSTATDDTPPSDDDTDVSLDPAEEERKRMDAIRRMLAGRYGRAETNLTMGRSFGEGSGRSLTGMS